MSEERHTCVCGHSILDHSRVGIIMYEDLRCIWRKHFFLPWTWCNCAFYQEQERGSASRLESTGSGT